MRVTRIWILVGLLAAASAPGLAQAPALDVGGPFKRGYVVGAPFSADATTTIRQTRQDGSVAEWTTNARYYRDSTGRVRVDQTVWSSDARDRRVKITVQPELETRWVFVIDPSAKTARRVPRGMADMEVAGGHSFVVPTSINRHEAVLRESITADDVVDPDLGLLIHSRYSNPSRGVEVDYRVTNIRRVEPSADLFDAPPPDYAIGRTGNDGWVGWSFPRKDRRPKTED